MLKLDYDLIAFKALAVGAVLSLDLSNHVAVFYENIQ